MLNTSFSRRSLARAALGSLPGVLAVPSILSTSKLYAQNGFPSFDQRQISGNTITSFWGIFSGMANDVYRTGTTSPGNLGYAQSVYQELTGQLQNSGFNYASLEYLSQGFNVPNTANLYTWLQDNGAQLTMGSDYLYQ